MKRCVQVILPLARQRAYLELTAPRHPRHLRPRHARALAQLPMAIYFLETADGRKSTPGYRGQRDHPLGVAVRVFADAEHGRVHGHYGGLVTALVGVPMADQWKEVEERVRVRTRVLGWCQVGDA